MQVAKRTPKPSPGHKPSLPKKPQPCHQKASGLQYPGRSEVTPVGPICPLRVSATYEIFPTAGILPHPPGP